MGQHVTIDIVDRPEAGIVGVRRAVRRAAASHGVPMLVFTTVRFTSSFRSNPLTPRRIGIISAWGSREAADRGWDEIVAPVTSGRENWHALGEVTRADSTGPFGPWEPDPAGSSRLDGDEPALVLIKGDFANSHWRDFVRGGVRAGAQLEDAAGYLGGVGLHRPVFEMTSMSCWATMKDARAYAYASGAHAGVMKRALDEGWSRRNAFVTVRPLRTHGTISGSDPFTGLLP